MNFLAPVLVSFVLIGGSVSYIAETLSNDTKVGVQNLEKLGTIDIASSGLDIVRTGIINDTDWSDNLGINVHSSEIDSNGFYPFQSQQLNAKLSDYELNNGELTVLFKPLTANSIQVISIGEQGGKTTTLGAVFNRNSNINDKLPVIYSSGKSHLEDTTLCTYVYDSKTGELIGITNPRLSIYMDGDFLFQGLDILESDEVANNETFLDYIERNLTLYANPSEYLNENGEKINRLDILGDGDNSIHYNNINSVGGVGLFNGSSADKITSNESFVTDYQSCVEKFGSKRCGNENDFIEGTAELINDDLEGSGEEYQHPEFKREIEDHVIPSINNGHILICGGNLSQAKGELPDTCGMRSSNNPYDPDTETGLYNAYNWGFSSTENLKKNDEVPNCYSSYTEYYNGAQGLYNELINSTSYLLPNGLDINKNNTTITPYNYFKDFSEDEINAWVYGYQNHLQGTTVCDTKYSLTGSLKYNIDRRYGSSFDLTSRIEETNEEQKVILTVENVYLNYGAGYENVFGYYWESNSGVPLQGRIVYPSSKYADPVNGRTSSLKIENGEFLPKKDIDIGNIPSTATKIGMWLGADLTGYRIRNEGKIEKQIGGFNGNWKEITSGEENQICELTENNTNYYSKNTNYYSNLFKEGYDNYKKNYNENYCDKKYKDISLRDSCNQGLSTAWGEINSSVNCSNTFKYQTVQNEGNDVLYEGKNLETAFNSLIKGVSVLNIKDGTEYLANILENQNFYQHENKGISLPIYKEIKSTNIDEYETSIKGNLIIDESSGYYFVMRVDDDKRMSINGNYLQFKEIINGTNNLSNNYIDTWNNSVWDKYYISEVYLTKGIHSFELNARENQGGDKIYVFWKKRDGNYISSFYNDGFNPKTQNQFLKNGYEWLTTHNFTINNINNTITCNQLSDFPGSNEYTGSELSSWEHGYSGYDCNYTNSSEQLSCLFGKSTKYGMNNITRNCKTEYTTTTTLSKKTLSLNNLINITAFSNNQSIDKIGLSVYNLDNSSGCIGGSNKPNLVYQYNKKLYLNDANNICGYIFDNDSSRVNTNYLLESQINVRDRNQGENAGVGFIFGYENSSNYYLARWVDFSGNYSNSSKYRNLQILKTRGYAPNNEDDYEILSEIENFNPGSNQFIFSVLVEENKSIKILIDNIEKVSYYNNELNIPIRKYGFYNNNNKAHNNSFVTYNNFYLYEISSNGRQNKDISLITIPENSTIFRSGCEKGQGFKLGINNPGKSSEDIYNDSLLSSNQKIGFEYRNSVCTVQYSVISSDGLVSNEKLWNSLNNLEYCEKGQGFKLGIENIKSTSNYCEALSGNKNLGCLEVDSICETITELKPIDFFYDTAYVDFILNPFESGQYMGRIYKTVDDTIYRYTGLTRQNSSYLFSNKSINPLNKSWEVKGISKEENATIYNSVINQSNGSYYLKDHKGNNKYKLKEDLSSKIYLWEDSSGSSLTGEQLKDLPASSSDTGGRDLGYKIEVNRSVPAYANQLCKEGLRYGQSLTNACSVGQNVNLNEEDRCTYHEIGTNPSMPIIDGLFSYEMLIVQDDCELDLNKNFYHFDNVYVALNNHLEIVDPGKILRIKKLELAQSASMNISFTEKEDEVTQIISDVVNLSGNQASFTCSDIKTCLLDTNNFTNFNSKTNGWSNGGKMEVSMVVREDFVSQFQGGGADSVYFIGNVIRQNMHSERNTVCNVVDEEGNSIINNNSEDFFNIVSDKNTFISSGIPEMVFRIICSDYNDCVSKF